jgi:hypothetical protein
MDYRSLIGSSCILSAGQSKEGDLFIVAAAESQSAFTGPKRPFHQRYIEYVSVSMSIACYFTP